MNVFSYESKPMQILMYLGDLIILNLVYLICCFPIFTIGAAQAGLFNAVKVLQDPEDDSSPTAAFFKGFANGFGKVTLAWCLMTVLLVIIAVACMFGYSLGLPTVLCIIPVVIVAMFQTLVPIFHSRFDCTAMQLIRNSWFLMFAHPIRSIGAVLLIWIPVVVFLLNAYTFMMLTPLWGTVYYSAAALFGHLFLKKPFKTLIDEFNSRQEKANNTAEEAALPDGTEDPTAEEAGEDDAEYVATDSGQNSEEEPICEETTVS